jgi:hypothetical protein
MAGNPVVSVGRLLAESTEQSDSGRHQRGDEVCRYAPVGSLEWGPAEGVGPDLVEGVRRIKSQDGPKLLLSGSSTLTSTVLEHELAD